MGFSILSSKEIHQSRESDESRLEMKFCLQLLVIQRLVQISSQSLKLTVDAPSSSSPRWIDDLRLRESIEVLDGRRRGRLRTHDGQEVTVLSLGLLLALLDPIENPRVTQLMINIKAPKSKANEDGRNL